MSVGSKIASLFPYVKFHGKSSIHRSICGSFGTTVTPAHRSKPSVKSTLSEVVETAMPEVLLEHLQKKFGAMDWQISKSEFSDLILVDIHRHMTGQGDTHTDKKIKNPVTGNVFHQLAFMGDIVGGLRIWVCGGEFGFRFRLAKLVKQEDKQGVIKLSRTKTLSCVKEAVKIRNEYQIAEPVLEELEKNKKRVKVSS